MLVARRLLRMQLSRVSRHRRIGDTSRQANSASGTAVFLSLTKPGRHHGRSAASVDASHVEVGVATRARVHDCRRRPRPSFGVQTAHLQGVAGYKRSFSGDAFVGWTPQTRGPVGSEVGERGMGNFGSIVVLLHG